MSRVRSLHLPVSTFYNFFFVTDAATKCTGVLVPDNLFRAALYLRVRLQPTPVTHSRDRVLSLLANIGQGFWWQRQFRKKNSFVTLASDFPDLISPAGEVETDTDVVTSTAGDATLSI
jgi:hypothetical protein